MRKTPDSAILRAGRAGFARYVAAVLAIAAGLIHFAVAPEHFAEVFEFGVFMVAADAAQIAAGVLLLARPSCKLLVATVLGTLLLFAIYAVSRTFGLPFGPHPGQPEEVGATDVVSKTTEFVLLLALAPFAAGFCRRRGGAVSR